MNAFGVPLSVVGLVFTCRSYRTSGTPLHFGCGCAALGESKRFSLCHRNQNQVNIMEPENLDIESITEARRKAVEQTVEPIGIDELKSLGEKIFPFLDHPWRDTFFQFLEENRGNTFYHATTNDQAEIIYCPAKEKGMWFVPRGGAGPLQARGLEIMKEIVGER